MTPEEFTAFVGKYGDYTEVLLVGRLIQATTALRDHVNFIATGSSGALTLSSIDRLEMLIDQVSIEADLIVSRAGSDAAAATRLAGVLAPLPSPVSTLTDLQTTLATVQAAGDALVPVTQAAVASVDHTPVASAQTLSTGRQRTRPQARTAIDASAVDGTAYRQSPEMLAFLSSLNGALGS